jgi:ribonuclease HII
MNRPSLRELAEKADGMALAEACEWLLKLSEEFGDPVRKLADKYYRRLQAEEREIKRLHDMMSMEREAYLDGFSNVGGIDEAGRGPLAGPVVAACVILPKDCLIYGLNDSKKLTPEKRDKLYDEIKEKAVSYGIGIADHTYIDRVNILNATRKAMETAVLAMKTRPDYLIIDAVRLSLDIPQKAVPGADASSVSVAAASILAKVTRDRIMEKMDLKYPGYGFAQHKGYGTGVHVEAIRRLGLCAIHRRSFTGNFLDSEKSS